MINKLIEKGADINYEDDDGKTALHFATGDVEVIEALVNAGADVNAQDENGQTHITYVR